MAELRVPNEDEFLLLLQDRTFVDYFNVFLSLPVFGQHVFYNYHDRCFEYEPPLKRRKNYLDLLEVVRWLLKERFPSFLQTPLNLEYVLAIEIRDIDIDTETLQIREAREGSDQRSVFGRSLFGNVTGMLLFRESMRGTCGEKVYQCWKAIEKLRYLENDEESKQTLVHYIKMKYITSGSANDLNTQYKEKIFQGIFNFDLTTDKEIEKNITQCFVSDKWVLPVDTVQALYCFQKLLCLAICKYWVPRYMVHVLRTASKETIEKLCKCIVYDLEEERKIRCTYLFPEVIEQPREYAFQTPVFLSNQAKDIPLTVGQQEFSCSSSDSETNIDPSDLLSLCGGTFPKLINVAMPMARKEGTTTNDSSESSVDSISSAFSEKSESQGSVSKIFSTTGDESVASIIAPTPIHVTSYLNGRRRLGMEHMSGSGNKVLCALASDSLASSPFKQYLIETEQTLDVHYLDFWRDVRSYLDAEESSKDKNGNPLRKMLAHMIAQRYLSSVGEESDIFSEGLKMQILHSLSDQDDVSLLCVVQDIVTGALQEPWRMFVAQERITFASRVCGRRMTTKLTRGTPSAITIKENSDVVDPLYFAQVSSFRISSASGSGSGSGLSQLARNNRIGSVLGVRLDSATECASQLSEFLVRLTREQITRALELSFLCEEYGSSGMVPSPLPSIDSLADVMYSDFGSLHISREPVTKQKELREMVFPPKINIETIEVSRKVMIGSMKSEPGIKEEIVPKCTRLIIRRNGVIIARPPRPKNFMDILTSLSHFDFFKRFMTVQKAEVPLNFWKEVEDLRDMLKPKSRHQKVTQIFRRYFSRAAKYGRNLDCPDELIKQIPMMEKVTASIMVCAQASVYRSMERKWYPRYLETYPLDVELQENSHAGLMAATPVFETNLTTLDKPQRPRRCPKKKTLQYWHYFISAVQEYIRALKNPAEVKLLELFLGTEMEREAIAAGQDKSMMSSTTATVQTRVVMKNRLVVVNRLTNDLQFWMEVQKYKQQVDSVTGLECISKDDTDQLGEKAKAIIQVFLTSEVPPKVQINIPNDLAATITSNLAAAGPVRGLFHDASYLLFPLLYHYWRKFENTWLKHHTSEELLAKLESKMNPRPVSPHRRMRQTSYLQSSWSDYNIIAMPMLEEDRFRITFSIMNGVRVIYPQPRGTRTQQPYEGDLRRNRFSSNSFVNSQTSSLGELRKVDPDKHVRIGNGSRVTSVSPTSTMGPAAGSFDKARRLSQLVEDINFMNKNRRVSKIKTFSQVVQAALHGGNPNVFSNSSWG